MKTLLTLVLLFTSAAFAATTEEEGIILNQELQFLEDSAKGIRVERQVTKTEEKQKSPEEVSLERTYFRDSEKDVIRTRAAAPRRSRLGSGVLEPEEP